MLLSGKEVMPVPAICDNLKQLRSARGLTQAEVAQRLGVTRQTISSYESGRTMPDLEMLKRLADILGCDLEQLLYGHSPAQRRQKRARRAAWIVLGAILASCLAASLLLWITNHIYVMPPGIAGDDPLVEARFRMRDLHDGALDLFATVTQLGTLLLLGLTIPLERPIPLREKLLWLAALALGLALATLPWGWSDPVYSLADYLTQPVLLFTEVALALLLGLACEFILKKYRRHIEKKRDRPG